MEDKIEITPTNGMPEHLVEQSAPRTGLHVRTQVRVGQTVIHNMTPDEYNKHFMEVGD